MRDWLRLAPLFVLIAASTPALAAFPTTRLTIWDLKPGQPVAAQPAPENYRGFACGSNGGPPHRPISGWSDFAKCPAEADGLHEVYFEYDDELEYIARAQSLENQITRWAGTTELRFPIITSALFNDAGVLQGIRIATDARPDYRNDLLQPQLHDRADAYQLAGVLAGRFDVSSTTDCKSLPPAEGESAVAGLFLKKRCEKIDAANNRRILIESNLYRRPGESEYDPQAPNELTKNQFESSARAEIRVLAPSK
jgi:hypothetical protein